MTTPTVEARAEAPPDPPDTTPTRPARRWSSSRVIAAVGVLVPSLFILFIMAGMVVGTVSKPGFPISDIEWGFPALLQANTPTGGDMGAHVLLPQLLRDELLPSGRLLGWSPDWYAGFPAFYFYFPLPALTTVLLDLLLPYGVAFKLTTIAGLVALPAASYFFVRSMGFSRIVSAIAAFTGGLYVFMESFSIYGANIKSTLAGEYSFSWSFALSLVYLGLVIRDTREGRRFSPAAAIVLALTALSHIVTTMVVVVVSLPLLLRRRGPRALGSAWLLGFGLAAFWALPLGVRVLQSLTTDMGWAPVTGILGEGIAPGVATTPLPDEFIPIAVLGFLGMAWSLLRRHDVIALVWMIGLAFAGYTLLPLMGITRLYNARLLPYWYFGLYLFAGIAIGLAVVAASRWIPERRQNLVIGSTLVFVLLLNVGIAGIHDVPGWVRWNFTGYEGKAAYPEYRGLMETVDALPPGRVMWEANNEMNRYGTPMALMLLPYWTEGDNPSMEGLFFESSLTTPFHFLNAAEVSLRPSNPVRGLDYHTMDFDRGSKHLQLYDVEYYVSFTPEAAEAARQHPDFTELAESPPFVVFQVAEAPLVEVATYEPVVYGGEGDFLEPALAWYDDIAVLDHWLVADGPDDWPRVESPEGPFAITDRITDGTAEVSNVVVEDHRLSFTTEAVGVPHLVKISYFPNWEAQGAEGPYRAAPSLMVVVPTQEDVVLEFVDQAPERWGRILTVVSLLAVAAWWMRRRRLVSARDAEGAQ